MSNSLDLHRQPCPDRVIEDAGTSFAMGAVGGSVFHFIKGLRNSPNGLRLAGGATAVRMNAPRVGGSFAVWGGLFSTFDCAMIYARKKEDPWNSIAAGAATGGLLALRRGVLAAGKGALVGGVFLSLIEGAGLMMSRAMANPAPPTEEELMMMQQQQYTAAQDPGAAADKYVQPGFVGGPKAPPIVVEEVPVADSGRAGGWFGGLLGRKKQDKVANGGDLGRERDPLELDLPGTAVPTFD